MSMTSGQVAEAGTMRERRRKRNSYQYSKVIVMKKKRSDSMKIIYI